MSIPAKTIAVVGSGALGLYYGGRLGLGGAEVRFLMRADLPTVQARGSIIVKEVTAAGRKTMELKPARAFGSPAAIGPVDLVLIALKATANSELERLLPPLLGPHTAIFTFQNGLGSDEFIARLFGPERVMGGLAFMASNRTAPGEVTCYHPGSVTLGAYGRPPDAATRMLAEQFTAAGVTTRVADNLLEARWRKLVWNVPFNGLAVANNLTTDILCATPALAADARALMHDVQHAAAAFGFTIPEDFLEQQFAATPGMGAYQPSSLVDFRAGREVEVEAIWGEPLRRAQARGVAVPRLASLYHRLKAVTAASRA